MAEKIPDPFTEPEAYAAWVEEGQKKLAEDVEKEMKDYDLY